MLLTELVGGKEEKAKLLAAGGFPELALVFDALNGNNAIIGFLKSKNQFIIAAFLSSILDNDKNAFDFLMKEKAPHWAATSNYLNKDKNAKIWLQKNNLSHYIDLADAIQKKFDADDGSGFEFLYKGPYS